MPANGSLLRILPDDLPLRGAGPLLDRSEWPPLRESDPPRALRSLAHIIEAGLCHRCGTCIGICPTKVLGLDNLGYPKVTALSNCTDCDLCVRVCPGDEFDLLEQYQQHYQLKPGITDTHGHFLSAVIAHASGSELREDSTSGGLVSAVLLHMLETKQIDGAVLIASDDNVLWKGKPIVARTAKEILACAKSKYAIAPTNSVLDQLREMPGRYAVVGLPCQIHGIVKAKQLDARLKERIVLTIGLFCHAAIEHEAFEVLWDHLGEKAKRAKRFISRIGKHPGTPHLELEDGTLSPVYYPERKGYRPSSIEFINILYRLYTPARCLTCFDASSEFADISVGDPWMAPPEDDVRFEEGWSFALIRSEAGASAINQSVADQRVTLRTVTKSEALKCNQLMSTEKRWRAFRVIETQRRQGKAIPVYGKYPFDLPRHKGLQFLETELHMLSHILCYMPTVRARVLRFMLRGGYWLFWLNNKRRRLRWLIRDLKAKFKRSVYGRR